MLLSIALSVFGLILYLGVVFNVANGTIGLLAFVLWIVLMVKAVQETRYKLPWAGDFAEQKSS